MIVPLNNQVVIDEVIRWGKYHLAILLQCPWGEVSIVIEPLGDKVKVSMSGPGIFDEEKRTQAHAIYQGMKAMVRERLADLDTRRAT